MIVPGIAPHIHRRDAGHDHSPPTRRRVDESGYADRRDRQGGADFRGDPRARCSEVLDPEQNKNFRDHYLDLPFDLSQVLFICTANTLDTISSPLRDRMEVIRSRAIPRRKLGIAKRYLLPKKLDGRTRPREQRVLRPALRAIIRATRAKQVSATWSARSATCCGRRHDRSRRESPALRSSASTSGVAFRPATSLQGQVRKRTSEPGVATGLAFTAVGGDVLFFEATAYPGKGRLTITGQLGDVMQESAQAALSWVRAHAQTWASTRPGSRRTTSTCTFRRGRSRRTGPPQGSRWRLRSHRSSATSPSPRTSG